MKLSGTCWIVRKYGRIGGKDILKKTFVITSEKAMFDWTLKTTDNGTRKNYSVEEVKCYS